jgi:hypothetical protein
MVDLRRQDDARSRRAAEAIIDGSARLARLLSLSDCFSIDFRIDATRKPAFLEFEAAPAVTIHDFQNYLAGRGLSLGAALAKAMRIAFARRMRRPRPERASGPRGEFLAVGSRSPRSPLLLSRPSMKDR